MSESNWQSFKLLFLSWWGPRCQIGSLGTLAPSPVKFLIPNSLTIGHDVAMLAPNQGELT
jgi:hypothetical protein